MCVFEAPLHAHDQWPMVPRPVQTCTPKARTLVPQGWPVSPIDATRSTRSSVALRLGFADHGVARELTQTVRHVLSDMYSLTWPIPGSGCIVPQ